MIVYGHRSFELKPASFLSRVVEELDRADTIPSHDAIVDLLISVGEAEAGVADALMPQVDADIDELKGWRDLAAQVASAFRASCRGDALVVGSSLQSARSSAIRLLSEPLPDCVRARIAEGFACYALYPEQYVDAAEQLRLAAHPRRVFCLGLRSIGSILAQVFAATLSTAGVFSTVRSVRPRGHPFDRRLRLAPSLVRTLLTTPSDLVAVIDEGPGLSGSSLAAAAEQLTELGIPGDRVVLVPGWDADPKRLLSSRGQRAWAGHRRFVGNFRRSPDGDSLQEISGGCWRVPVLGEDGTRWPAVQPQHERPKFIDWNTRTVWRFAGLGTSGKRACARAHRIAEAGFGPRPVRLDRGFLQLEWVDGRPVSAPSENFTDRVADYLAFLGGEFQTGDADDIDELARMVEVNTSEAGLSVDVDALSTEVRQGGVGRIAGDGRMGLHEWIAKDSCPVKVDHLDHHADDFFPGCRDVAWDVAGACLEGNLPPAACERLVARYKMLSRDTDIERRLPFYAAAYAAYRLGYARMAANTVGNPDEAARFRSLEGMYADRLRRLQRSA